MSGTTEENLVSLSNLARGAVVERFDDELRRCLENIQDPNTTLAVRTITLKVKIKPDQNRDFGGVGVTCSSTLAPACPVETKISIGKDKSGAIATEFDSRQPGLPGVVETKPAAVLPIRSVGGAKL